MTHRDHRALKASAKNEATNERPVVWADAKKPSFWRLKGCKNQSFDDFGYLKTPFFWDEQPGLSTFFRF